MSLTVTEAAAVNEVVRYWLEIDDAVEVPIPDQKALDAMAYLADQAYRKLHAGLNGERVRRRWAELDRSPKPAPDDQAVSR